MTTPLDYLQYMPTARQQEVAALSLQHQQRLAQNKKGFLRFREPYESLAGIRATDMDFDQDAVRIGGADQLGEEEQAKVYEVMRSFMPWRKGPFDVFGIEIDAEWRSERKWNRVKEALPDLKDKVIADIGCNNGYYMFRTAAHQPKAVLGFEPYIQHYYCFKTLNRLAGQENLFIEPFGVEDIGLFPSSFDVIFLMGIIYHRISPIEMLREIKEAMKPGGVLILESQAIPGEQPVALFPESRYAKVPGTYFVPTAACLKNWLTRVGFKDVEVFASHPMSNKEQRKTDWMVFESYDDFIDPENSDLTVEGYPAPHRVYVRATV